jgi:hypothetical protein
VKEATTGLGFQQYPANYILHHPYRNSTYFFHSKGPKKKEVKVLVCYLDTRPSASHGYILGVHMNEGTLLNNVMNFKRVFRIFIFLGLPPKIQIITGATKKKEDCMLFPRLKKKAHNLVTMEGF